MINSWTIITKQQAKYYTSEFSMKGKRNAQENPYLIYKLSYLCGCVFC